MKAIAKICATLVWLSFVVSCALVSADDSRLLKSGIRPSATNYLGQMQHYVPTNTVEFKKFALSVMVSKVNLLNDMFEIGFPHPVQEKDLLKFSAYPKTNSFDAEMMLKDWRGTILDGKFTGLCNDDMAQWWEFAPLEGIYPDDRDSKMQALVKFYDGSTTDAQVKEGMIKSLRHPEKRDELEREGKLTVSRVSYKLKNGESLQVPIWDVTWGTYRMQYSGFGKGGIVAIASSSSEMNVGLPKNYRSLLGYSEQK